MMTRLTLVGAVLALAVGMTAAAMASDQRAGKSGHHIGHFQHHSRLAGVRGPEGRYPGSAGPVHSGGFIDLGPLGFTAACGSYANRYRSDYCGPRNGAPIDAWSY